mgnify:CR=1 FL=1
MRTFFAMCLALLSGVRAQDDMDMAKMYFGMLDTDFDGKVTRPELNTFVTNMMAMSGVEGLANDPGVQPMIDTAFELTDKDKSGDISIDEAAVTQEEITKMVGAFMASHLNGADL